MQIRFLDGEDEEFELTERSGSYESYDLSHLIRDPFFKKEIEHPVTTPKGITYDGKLLGGWIDKNHDDPIDATTLYRFQLCPNRLFSSIKHIIKAINCSRAWHDHEDNLYSLLICPLSGEPFKEPVLASDGYTYEKAYISAYLRKYINTPMGSKQTGPFYPNSIIEQLMTNTRVKKLVDRKSKPFDLDQTTQEEIKQLRSYLSKRLQEENYAGSQFGYCAWDKIEPTTKLIHTLEKKYSAARFFSQKDSLHPPLQQGRVKAIAEPVLLRLEQNKKLR